MPKRIPHTDLEVITGNKTTEDYLKMQKKLGKFYFKDFFSKLDNLAKGKRFLEVGPGPGYQTTLVAEKYHPQEIIGLEYSKDMVIVAEKYARERNLSGTIKYINGSVEDERIYHNLGKFGLIYSTFSLHHWPNPTTAINMLYSSLNDKGVLFIYDFYRGGIFYYLKIKRGIWESIRASYTSQELTHFMEELSIKNYKIEKKGLYLSIIIEK